MVFLKRAHLFPNTWFQNRLFVWFWSKIKTYKGYHDGLRSRKLAHFGPLQNMQSADPICRSRGELRILEFGAGPGKNGADISKKYVIRL